MTDKKFTDEEIIKALESALHRYKNVTHHVSCIVYINILKNTLDLINRQKAEIERLKECPKCVYEYDGEVTEYCVQGPCPNFKTVEQIKAEAYKEFAEKLKNKWFDERYYSPDVDFDDFIDTLLKEMVGEEE